MPRANRHRLPGHVWYITHRCHRQQFLSKFARDRRRWRHWLFEARQRFWLCVLDFIVTSNHIHLGKRWGVKGDILLFQRSPTGPQAHLDLRAACRALHPSRRAKSR